MNSPPIRIPEKVVRTAWSLGEAGRAWLAGLPGQVARIADDWSVVVGEPAQGGTEAFVAKAVTREGQAAILKIKIPGLDSRRQECRTLRDAEGRGYARLLRADESGDVLLLERLGRQLAELGWPEAAQMQAICATLREAWAPLPDGPPFVTGAEKAAEFADFIETHWDAAARPCSQATVGLALEFAARRRAAFDPARSVLAHGDAHAWNTLCAPGSPNGFKFIDPDGAFAEPAFDLSVPMREWERIPDGDPLELGLKRCELLSRLSGVDPQPIWEWSLVQCVWNGLSLERIGASAPARVAFAMADAWSSRPRA